MSMFVPGEKSLVEAGEPQHAPTGELPARPGLAGGRSI